MQVLCFKIGATVECFVTVCMRIIVTKHYTNTTSSNILYHSMYVNCASVLISVIVYKVCANVSIFQCDGPHFVQCESVFFSRRYSRYRSGDITILTREVVHCKKI
jgi:hypothetical protein